MMGPQSQPYYSKKTATVANISAREHSSALWGEVTLKFSAARWKSSRGLNLCVYVAELSLGELLMNDADRWTPQLKAHTHTSTWGPRHTHQGFMHTLCRGRGHVGAHGTCKHVLGVCMCYEQKNAYNSRQKVLLALVKVEKASIKLCYINRFKV